MEKEFNPQEIFDTSKELYENTYDMLKDMTEYYKKKTGSGDFKYVIFVFDSILQFSLLQFALADNDLNQNEIIFIKNLTSTGGIVDYLRMVCDSDITWERIYKSDPQEILDELLEYKDKLIEDAQEFIKMFALTDAIVSKYDFFEILNGNTCEIAQGLCRIDGIFDESEYETSDILLLAVLGMIIQSKEKAKEFAKEVGLI